MRSNKTRSAGIDCRWDEKRQGYHPLRVARWIGLASIALVANLAIAGGSTLSGTIQLDSDGPDDQPNQKDLNSVQIDSSNVAEDGTLLVAWAHDMIPSDLKGRNTVDTCASFDSDQDGDANYMVCVTFDRHGDSSTTVYDCDDRGDENNCSGNAPAIHTPNTECSISTIDDAFGPRRKAQASDHQDTEILCSIDLDDVGGSDSMLTNICAYPSREPTSAASDCFSGFTMPAYIEVTKVCDGNTAPEDKVLMAKLSSAGEAPMWIELGCEGDDAHSGVLSIDAGRTYQLVETESGDALSTSIQCTRSDGELFGGAGVSKVHFSAGTGQLLTCTITNKYPNVIEPADGTIDICKDSYNYPLGTWFFGDLGDFDVNTREHPDADVPSREGACRYYDTTHKYTDYPYPSFADGTVLWIWEKNAAFISDWVRQSDFLSSECVIDRNGNGVADPSDPNIGNYTEITPDMYDDMELGMWITIKGGEHTICTWTNVARQIVKFQGDPNTAFDDRIEIFVPGVGIIAIARAAGDEIVNLQCIDPTPTEDYCFTQADGEALLRPGDASYNTIGFDGVYTVTINDSRPLSLTITPPDNGTQALVISATATTDIP